MLRMLFYIFISVLNFFIAVNGVGTSTFVIDDTASTKNTFDYSKNAIKSITAMFDVTFGVKNKTIITFNDPDTNHIITTDDTDKFKSALSTLTMHDGGDCSEMSMSGIHLALNKSEPKSHLYVFTDDTPKDLDLVDGVKLLCNEKQSQVDIIVTQNPACLQFEESFLPYIDVVEACSGQFFYLRDKAHVSWVMPYINETISGQNALLARKTIEPEVYTEVPFTFDDLTDYVIISLSGDKVSIDVNKDVPNISIVSKDTLAWTPNVKTYKLFKDPGLYTVRVRSLSNSSLIIFGRTNFILQYGFSEYTPLSINETNKQPYGGTLSYLTVEDSNDVVELTSVEVNELKMSLYKIPNNLYMTGQLTVPKNKFTIFFNGKTKSTGKPFRRSAVVLPKKYDTPIYNASDVINVLEKKLINLTCPLDAKEIKWYKTDKANIFRTTTEKPKKSMLIKEGTEHFYAKNNAVFSDDGLYKCKDNGIHEWTVEVIVGIVPKFSDGSIENSRVISWDGSEQLLRCDVESKPIADFEWYYNNQLIKDWNYSTLKISGWGIYVCRVKNFHGRLLRSFRVQTNENCLINKAAESIGNMPLLLKSQSEWAYLQKNKDFLVMPTHKTLLLSCSSENHFKKFPDISQLEAVCVNEDKFKVNNEVIKISELNCIEKVQPTMKIIDGRYCYAKSHVVQVGFYVQPSDLLPVYELCVENETNTTVYTKIDMVSIQYDSNLIYDKKWTIYVYEQGIDNTEINEDEYYRGHLLNAQDVVFGPQQASLNTSFNEIHIFKPRNMTTWQNIEETIREDSNDIYNLTVWSGFSDVKTVDGKLLPKYLWKLIRNNEDEEVSAIVYLNSPVLPMEDKLCKNTCAYGRIQFTESPNIDCCNQENFYKYYKNLNDNAVLS